MFPERLIVDGSLRQRDGSISVALRIPWYRALPLASIVVLDVEVNGRPIPPEHLAVEYGGVTRRFADLAPCHDIWWYVLDDALLHIDAEAPQAPVRVAVRLGLRIPYLPVDGAPLVIVERCEKTFAAVAA